MSKRLASFHGPSTPTSTPVQPRQQPSTPASPSRNSETTYHRKVRTLLQELRSITRTWDELVRMDGLKAITSLTDARTDLDNALRLLPTNEPPRTHIVGPRLAIMEKSISELDVVLVKLGKQFAKMNSAVESLEDVLSEAHKMKGWAWVHEEPLWCTWTLENFVSNVTRLLFPYHRCLEEQRELAKAFRSHSLSFEDSSKMIAEWTAQVHLEDDDFVLDWQDLCEAEVERWNAR